MTTASTSTFDADLRSSDPLGFVDSKPYTRPPRGMQQATNLCRRPDLRRAARWPAARQICAMEPRFIGGSMGCVVGEKITRAIERAIAGARAAGHRLRLRRRAHAGRRRQPDADGQDLGRA